MPRLFFAIPLPEETRRELHDFSRSLPFNGVKWVAEEHLHITVRFIGDFELPELPSAELVGVAPFEIELDRFGVFPPGKRRPPRVFWVGIGKGAGAVVDVAARVDRGLARWGLQPENRPFTPHVTLGRIRRGGQAPRGIDPAPYEFPRCSVEVRSVVLYESELSPRGPRYSERARMDFHAGS